MADPFRLFLFFVFSFLLQLEYSFVHAQCSPTEPCNQGGPVIQFPFWRKGQRSDFCKTPGFELSCNKKNKTILSLPFSGDFIVKDINYDQQLVLINDPDSCLPKRMDNFNLFQSPFIGVFSGRYNFFNCSSNWTYTGEKNVTDRFVQLSCISSKNYTVYVVPSYITEQEIPSSCFNVNESDIEWFNSQYWSAMNAKGDLELKWRMSKLECWDCVRKGLRCGITEDDEVVCVIPEEKESKHGIPRSAKYGIILGAGIPGMLLMIGLGCHICNKIKKYSSQNQLLSTELSTTITPQPVITIIGGLDGQTIESYPKTVLGESRRLPKTSDGTCPICLCEYQPNETLRSIPECNHYFHVNCIDEWLKLNGTCPLCRNSLESFLVTPCSSTFSTSS